MGWYPKIKELFNSEVKHGLLVSPDVFCFPLVEKNGFQRHLQWTENIIILSNVKTSTIIMTAETCDEILRGLPCKYYVNPIIQPGYLQSSF